MVPWSVACGAYGVGLDTSTFWDGMPECQFDGSFCLSEGDGIFRLL